MTQTWEPQCASAPVYILYEEGAHGIGRKKERFVDGPGGVLSTHPRLQLPHHALALLHRERLSLLQPYGDLADLHLQLFAQRVGVLVVVGLEPQLLREAAHLRLQAVGTLVGRAAPVERLVEVGLHRRDVRLHAALVVRQRRDGDRQLADASRHLVQLRVGVLARTLRLPTRRIRRDNDLKRHVMYSLILYCQ